MAGTPTPVAISGSRPSVAVETVDNLYVANNIIDFHTHRGTGEQQLILESDELEEDSGCEVSSGTHASRWTQTNGFIYAGHKESVRISDNYTRVDLRINENAARILADNDSNVEKVEKTVIKCLARFEWNGCEILSKYKTAWKLEMKKGMDQLLKDVMDKISKEVSRKNLRGAMQKLFDDFGMMLMGLDQKCLVFIFQHSSVEDGKRILSSMEDQKVIQNILLGLLPAWVRESDVLWQVMECHGSPNETPECQLGEPIQLFSQQSGNVASMDCRLIEQIIERYMNSVRQDIVKTQKQLAREQVEVLRQAMQTFLTAQASPVSESERSQLQVMQSVPSPSPASETSAAVSVLVPGGSSSDHRTHAETQISSGDLSVDNGGGDSEKGNTSSDGGLYDEETQDPVDDKVKQEKDLRQTDFSTEISKARVPAHKELSEKDASADNSSPSAKRTTHSFPEMQTAMAAHASASACPTLSHPPLLHTIKKSTGDTSQGDHDSAYGSAAQLEIGKHATPMESGFCSHKFQSLSSNVERMDAHVQHQNLHLKQEATDDPSTTKKHISRDEERTRFSSEGVERMDAHVQPQNLHLKQEATDDPSTTKKHISRDEERTRFSSEGDEDPPKKRTRSRSRTEDESSDEARTPDSTKKSSGRKTIQAEQLLNWVNVKSKASESKDPEIQRMMDQVEDALRDEDGPSPRARALDTVIILDTSESVVRDNLDELKTVIHTFIDGKIILRSCIEENVDSMNLEENLAVVQVGGRATVRQHLTNDYNRVRDAIDAMTPDSKKMRTGGRTPLFQALLVCLGVIEGRGGVVNVAGCHRVRPRLIFFTDGRPTDEATEFGLDTQTNVNEVKFALVQLISEFASKKHKTTPAPIFWVPVGDPDRPFLDSLAALSGGKVVEPDRVEELCRYYKIQETIGCVFKMVRKHKDIYETEQQTISIVNALAGNLDEVEKKYIMDEVRKKQKDPENETSDADDFDGVFEDTEYVDENKLLPLGTRVRRGPQWKWNNQDTEGPGTVIQHRKQRDGWLHVMWDNGTHNAYRYGDSDCYDVQLVDEPRRLDGSQLIEIGVQVRRGADWSSGEEDGNGVGIVIRKRKDGKVKVRWANGNIGKHKYGADGKMELGIDKVAFEKVPEQNVSVVAQPEPLEEQGAVGGVEPAEGRRVWQWYDQHIKDWRTYDASIQDKLLQAYNQRKDGSCVIKRGGISRRVLFKTGQEKTVDRGGYLPIQSQVVSEEQYVQMLQREEER